MRLRDFPKLKTFYMTYTDHLDNDSHLRGHDMGFGKRGRRPAPQTRTRTSSANAGASEQAPQQVDALELHSETDRSGWDLLYGAAIGFSLCMIFVIIANYLSLRSIMATMEASWGPPAGFESLKRDPAKINEVDKTVRRSCPNPRFGARLPPSGVVMGPLEMGLFSYVHDAIDAADYVKCTTGVQIERFCQKQPRLDLANHVRGYLEFRRRALKLARTLSTRPTTKFQALRNRIESSRPFFKKVIIDYDPLAKVDPLVVSRLQWFIEHGYFSKWDFGGMFSPAVPPELADHLEGTTQRTNLCK